MRLIIFSSNSNVFFDCPRLTKISLTLYIIISPSMSKVRCLFSAISRSQIYLLPTVQTLISKTLIGYTM